MKLTWPVFGLLILLNIALLVSNWILGRSLKTVSERKTAEEIAALRRERERLSAQRARLDARFGALVALVERLEALAGASPGGSAPAPSPGTEGEEGAGGRAFDVDQAFRSASLLASLERPRPGEIPLLTAEEKADLEARRRRMPEELSEGVLLVGDVDAVLSDPGWNPRRRSLSDDERAELAALLSRYRYFARLAPLEMYHGMVALEVPRLREAGAYVEYPDGEAPPVDEGACTSHAEPSDTPGVWRIYYFHEEDYPAIAHHKRVAEERGFECFVEAYEIINGDGGSEAASGGALGEGGRRREDVEDTR